MAGSETNARRTCLLALTVAVFVSGCAAPQWQRTFFLRWQGQSGRVTVDRSGRVVDAAPAASPRAADIEVGGGIARQGLHDAHIHLMGTGRVSERVNLRGVTRAELRSRVAAFAASNPAVRVITGRGWDQSLWQDKAFPTWRDLDGATDKPVLVRRVDGHASLANRAMMALAGITRETQSPQGGRIERDADGEPTGVFVDTAMALLSDKVPKPTLADRRRWLRRAVEAVADAGFVAAHDMGMDLPTLTALQAEDAAQPLPLRVFVYLDSDDPGALPWLQARLGAARRLSARIEVKGMKLFADGAMGSRGAALVGEYSDKPGHRGALILTPAQLLERVAKVHALRAQVAIHAIGDRAAGAALDAIEAAQRDGFVPGHRIEHAQLLTTRDFARMAALRVTASMQPCHLLSDRRWVMARLGPQRAQRAYAWSKMRSHAVLLAFGSDSPVEPFAPARGLQIASQSSSARFPAWITAKQIPASAAWSAYSSAGAQAVRAPADRPARDSQRAGGSTRPWGPPPGQLLEVSVFAEQRARATIIGTVLRAISAQ